MTAYLPILATFLGVAAASDIARRSVPNLVVAPLAAAGLVAQWVSGGAACAGDGALAGCAVLGALAFPWARGILGGGDVKLAAAAAIWLGLGSVVPFLLYAGAAGLPVALAVRLPRHLALGRFAAAGSNAGAAAESRETAPVAVAIALGAFAVLWVKP